MMQQLGVICSIKITGSCIQRFIRLFVQVNDHHVGVGRSRSHEERQIIAQIPKPVAHRRQVQNESDADGQKTSEAASEPWLMQIFG